MDEAERAWVLKGALVGAPQPNTALAVSTWNDLDAAARTWDQVDAMRLDWDAFDRTIWQEVGG